VSRGRPNPNRTLRQEAASAVSVATFTGQLPRAATLACHVCSKPARHYHHHSYEREFHLDVVALCVPCHSAVHHGKIPEPRTGEIRTGDRLKVRGDAWGNDHTALYAVLSNDGWPPYMSKARHANVSAFIDANCPFDWRTAEWSDRYAWMKRFPYHESFICFTRFADAAPVACACAWVLA
jgi:hypothetical protein